MRASCSCAYCTHPGQLPRPSCPPPPPLQSLHPPSCGEPNAMELRSVVTFGAFSRIAGRRKSRAGLSPAALPPPSVTPALPVAEGLQRPPETTCPPSPEAQWGWGAEGLGRAAQTYSPCRAHGSWVSATRASWFQTMGAEDVQIMKSIHLHSGGTGLLLCPFFTDEELRPESMKTAAWL
jgi:hypothetical protein